MKNFEVKNFGGADELARAVAGDWLDLLAESDAPHLAALSGGRIAKNFYAAVTNLSRGKGVSLRNVDFFWADERCVPPSDPESNYLLAKENLFDELGLAPEKVHRLKGELPPAAAVSEANTTIERIAPRDGTGLPVLDVIFLGLGEDGHIASLMPNLPPDRAAIKAPYLHVEKSPKPPPDRLSMSYAVIAAAKNVWMLASGTGKEEALRQSLRPGGYTPFGRVLQSRANTVIYSSINVGA